MLRAPLASELRLGAFLTSLAGYGLLILCYRGVPAINELGNPFQQVLTAGGQDCAASLKTMSLLAHVDNPGNVVPAAPSVPLNDGRSMPAVGYGTYTVSCKDTYFQVRDALAIGYRHIDTASGYRNEASVGRAVRDSGIPRGDLWITTKASEMNEGGAVSYNETLAALNRSLGLLQLAYVDMYLIHTPRDSLNRLDQWRALVHARAAGLARSIGVSDYHAAELREIQAAGLPVPAVLQMELNPWLLKERASELAWCAERGVVVESWSATAAGSQHHIDPELQQVVARHVSRGVFVSSYDILIRFALQRGFVPILRSSTPSHMAANLAVATADWHLDMQDMETVAEVAAHPFFAHGLDLSGADFFARNRVAEATKQ